MISERENLDIVRVKLQGTALIEASAGTGKTYAITGLYLRLLLEEELTVEQIVVVTFTEAATKELRDRIRSRLREAVIGFDGGETNDTFIGEIYEHYRKEGRDLAACRLRLTLALSSLDRASIFTIHGFCARVLNDAAFDIGLPFDLSVQEGDAEILGECIDDYWRFHVDAWSPIFVQYLYLQGCNPDTLFERLSKVIPLVRAHGIEALVLPPTQSPESFSCSFEPLLKEWAEERETIIALLQSTALSKNKKTGYTADRVRRFVDEFDRYAAGKEALLPLAAVRFFSADTLQNETLAKKQGETPQHRFFDLCHELLIQCVACENGLRLAVLAFVLEQLPQRKERAAVLTFDDLLLRLRDGLRSETASDRLAATIRKQFPAALIDEFQDTDIVQYEIFHTVYRSPRTPLFLIGDPKQAIYRFRGADIYAYIQAVANADSTYGMEVNWRSEPGLVRALNLLFGNTGDCPPFLVPEIGYQSVLPKPQGILQLHTPDTPGAPLTFVHFSSTEDKPRAKQMIAKDLAVRLRALIASGKEGRAFFETEESVRTPVSSGDMAVLVRNHKDAALVQDALREEGVASVITSRSDVFGSRVAFELQILLENLLQGARLQSIVNILSTMFFRWQAEPLQALQENEDEAQKLAQRFQEYRTLWHKKGFAPMVFALLRREGVQERLAEEKDAHRLLTDLRHIIELLQEKSHFQDMGPAALVDWLKKQRHGTEGSEERLLRLERDDELVSIVTIHASKGLEYPLVFCPFLWDAPRSVSTANGWLAWHDESGAVRIDMRDDLNEAKRQVVEENLAEEFRLLYVAVTRTRNRCYIYWGDVLSRKSSVTAKSALAVLLSFQEDLEPAGDFYDEHMRADSLIGPCWRLTAHDPEAVAVVRAGEQQEASHPFQKEPQSILPAAQLSREIASSWSILSFSSLLRGRDVGPEENEEPDHDIQRLLPESSSPVSTPSSPMPAFFSFPKGAQAGSCLHDIFEKIDFTVDPSSEATGNLIADALRRFNYESSLQEIVGQGLQETLNTALDRDSPEFCLAALGRERRISEMEFYFSLPSAPENTLRELFQGKGPPAKPIGKGICFMKGYIDLIFQWRGRFYIVDYKSNFLGEQPDDYAPDQLAHEMLQAGYDLQYHIYLVALQRYLRCRLPDYDYDRHIGGVYYLFLRGMSPATGEHGIFAARPDRQIVEAMDSVLEQQSVG